MLKTTPAVFAVGKTYQIMVEVTSESLMSVKIGENTYYDESNGIMNSLLPIHRVSVPIDELNTAKEYTVCIRPIIERKPYFTETKDIIEYRFYFKPVPKTNVRAYHISDAHNRIDAPVQAAKAFGDIDFLILNGDIIDHSGDLENFSTVYEICSKITNGNIPVVFSRGNHDLRGNFAEKFADYTPNFQKNTYYTFRIGSIWGLLLDCGEDKDDNNAEYGFTVACHQFRKRQIDFIKSIIQNAKQEYEEDGIKTKLVITHNPFTRKLGEPFIIEEEIYNEWITLLREFIKPHLMICGHTHIYDIYYPDGEFDHFGQPCPVIIGSQPEIDRFIGCGFTFGNDEIKVQFNDNHGNFLLNETFKYHSK